MLRTRINKRSVLYVINTIIHINGELRLRGTTSAIENQNVSKISSYCRVNQWEFQ